MSFNIYQGNYRISPIFSPNLVAHYAANLIYGNTTTTLPNSGSAISSIKDLSGNGNDLLTVAGSSAPLFFTNIVNGLPGIFFSQVMLMGKNNPRASSSMKGVSGYTMIAAVELYNSGATGYLFTFGGSTDQARCSIGINNAGSYNLNARPTDGGVLSTLNASAAVGGFVVFTGIVDFVARTAEIFINGVSRNSSSAFTAGIPASNTNSAEVVMNGQSILPTNTLSCDLAELLAYNVALTPAQRVTSENYLRAKYNL